MTTFHRRTRPPFMPNQHQGRLDDTPATSMPLYVVLFSLLAWAAIVVVAMMVWP